MATYPTLRAAVDDLKPTEIRFHGLPEWHPIASDEGRRLIGIWDSKVAVGSDGAVRDGLDGSLAVLLRLSLEAAARCGSPLASAPSLFNLVPALRGAR